MKARVKVALKLNNLTPSGKVVRSQSIKDSMYNSGNFPSAVMPISYSILQNTINDLQNAIVAADNGTTNDTEIMHEMERNLVSTFNFIKSFVEMKANATANPAAIITSAGMQVSVSGGSNAVTDLSLDAIGNGSLEIRIPRLADEKAFVFETSTDNVTWTEATATTLTKTEIKSLTPGNTVYVRYYAISKTGKGAYSSVKSAIIL